jgi:hypothetical protein
VVDAHHGGDVEQAFRSESRLGLLIQLLVDVVTCRQCLGEPGSELLMLAQAFGDVSAGESTDLP